MNEVIRALIERRSARSYKEEKITEAELSAILNAGLYAPSGMNRQVAHMVAVEDKATRDKLSRMNAAVMGQDGDPFYGAPTVVVVLVDRARSRTAVEDGCLVMQNLMLAAHSLGIGSCWIHRAREMFETDEGKALLKEWGLEGDFVGVGNCILGYRDCDYPPVPEKKTDMVVYVK